MSNLDGKEAHTTTTDSYEHISNDLGMKMEVTFENNFMKLKIILRACDIFFIPPPLPKKNLFAGAMGKICFFPSFKKIFV